MKTTVEISDRLFEEAKRTARERGLSFRELLEGGLRWAIREKPISSPAFRLRDGSVGGEGLAIDGAWPEIRAMIYKERGA